MRAQGVKVMVVLNVMGLKRVGWDVHKGSKTDWLPPRGKLIKIPA